VDCAGVVLFVSPALSSSQKRVILAERMSVTVTQIFAGVMASKLRI
jgi:hypothetical protein